MSSAAKKLLKEIESFCLDNGMAKSTFGRLAIKDGKLYSRLKNGKDVTLSTHARIKDFINHYKSHNNSNSTLKSTDQNNTQSEKISSARFYDNRQNYLSFINTTNEKWKIAERAVKELAFLKPTPPALRVFDAGMGDATILTHLMRSLHRRYPIMPFFIVAKEISLEDVRISLGRLSDRFMEHPATVMIVTNMYYSEAPWLRPGSINSAAALNWHEVALDGNSSHEYGEQLRGLESILVDGWQVKSSKNTGNPVYARPSVLVLYRKDHSFLLNNVIPKPGQVLGSYDFIIASQPWRARTSAKFKAKSVLGPLIKSLAPYGRLLAVQSSGIDPAQELINEIWPDEQPFQINRHALIKALKSELGRESKSFNFLAGTNKKSLIKYNMHVMPDDIGHSIGTSTLFAAWNAAVYVNQINDERIEPIIQSMRYLEVTAKILKKYNGLWFNDESFVVSKKGN
tara:strand:- start:5892 stop:7259 length:1368 start_codon:yes stop_codon:yes gene_type:complete